VLVLVLVLEEVAKGQSGKGVEDEGPRDESSGMRAPGS